MDFPSEEGVVAVKRGGPVTLAVKIASLADEPVEVRLTLVAGWRMPEFVSYEALGT